MDTGVSDIADQLERIEKLHSQGRLSDEEFRALKARIIGGDATRAPSETLRGHVQNESDEPEGFMGWWNQVRDAAREDSKFSIFDKLLFGAAAVGIIGACIYPLTMEGTTSYCSALETKLIRTQAAESKIASGPYDSFIIGVMAVAQRVSNGSVASEFVRRKWPNVPPFAGCGYIYDLNAFYEWIGDNKAEERSK